VYPCSQSSDSFESEFGAVVTDSNKDKYVTKLESFDDISENSEAVPTATVKATDPNAEMVALLQQMKILIQTSIDNMNPADSARVDTKGTTPVRDQPDVAPRCSSLLYRLRNSTIWSYWWCGQDIDSVEVDKLIHIFLLVNVIVIIVPFESIFNYNFEFWSEVDDLSQNCDREDRSRYVDVMSDIRRDFLTIMVGSVLATSICVIYFILRPIKRKGDEFVQWWIRGGRYPIFVCAVCTLLSLDTLVRFMAHIFRNYMLRPEDFCDQPNGVHTRLGYGVFIFTLLLSAVFMTI